VVMTTRIVSVSDVDSRNQFSILCNVKIDHRIVKVECRIVRFRDRDAGNDAKQASEQKT
jgi:hypothetical protein